MRPRLPKPWLPSLTGVGSLVLSFFLSLVTFSQRERESHHVCALRFPGRSRVVRDHYLAPLMCGPYSLCGGYAYIAS